MKPGLSYLCIIYLQTISQVHHIFMSDIEDYIYSIANILYSRNIYIQQSMEFESQIYSLQQQLNIPKDRFNTIIYTISQNFIKKYQNKIDRPVSTLILDLKQVLRQLDVYSQYTLNVLAKYQMLSKLQALVRGVFQNQSLLLNYMIGDMTTTLEMKQKTENQLLEMTKRVYYRCTTCEKNIQKCQIEKTQEDISIKFHDLFSYFQHDLEEINRLEEEARLLFVKKNLGMEGICEEIYIQKLLKMKENMESTIHYMTSSLDNISSFQKKLSEMQQFQNMSYKSENITSTFNPKNYTIQLSKYFQVKISKLTKKIDEINRFFTPLTTTQCQTILTSQQLSQDKVKILKENILELQIQNKQYQIYKNSLQMQVSEAKLKNNLIEQQKHSLEKQIQKYGVKIKNLQLEIELLRRKDDINKNDFMMSSIKECQENTLKNISNNKAVLENTEQRKLQDYKQQITEQDNQDDEGEINNEQNYENRRDQRFDTTLTKKSSMLLRQNNDRSSTKKTTGRESRVNQQINAVYRHNQRRKTILLSEPKADRSDKSDKTDEQKQQVNQKPQSLQNVINNQTRALRIIKKKQNSSTHSMNSVNRNNPLGIGIQAQHQITHEFSIIVSNSQNKSNYQKQKYNDEGCQQANKKDESRNIQELYQKYRNRVKISEGKNALSLEDFEKKIQCFMDSIIANKEKQSKTIKHEIKKMNEKTKKNESNKQNERRLSQIKQPSNQSAPQVQPIKRSLESTQRFKNNRFSKKAHEKLDIPLSMIMKTEEREDQGSQKSMLRTTKVNIARHNKNMDKRGRYSQILDSYETYLKQKQKQKIDFRTTATLLQNRFYEVGESRFVGEFTDEDDKIIFKFANNNIALLVNKQTNHRKSSSYFKKDLDSFTKIQISFTQQFFTRIANIHLYDASSYQKIRKFLASPFNSSIMNSLPSLNSQHSQNQMKQYLNNIIILHRRCTVKGQLCKHLTYFMNKIIKIEKHSQQVQV